MNRLSRRLLLASPLACALPAAARAEIIGTLVRGQDGWLFPLWEDVRKLDAARQRTALDTINQTTAKLKAARIDVAVTVAPMRARTYADKLPPEFQPAAAVTARYAQVLDSVRSGGALSPDFAALFAELRRSQSEAVFFRADSHWTAVGAEAAATELAKQIQAQNRLPPPRGPGTAMGALETRQVGNDLLPSLPEPMRAAYPPEKFRAHHIVSAKAASTAALLDEDGADLVVVGNSYTQPFLNFTPMLSNQLKRPVSLAWQIGTISPHRVLLDYLASTMFRDTRPKLLIWHHLEAGTEHPCDDAGWWGPSAMPVSKYLGELTRLLGG